MATFNSRKWSPRKTSRRRKSPELFSEYQYNYDQIEMERKSAQKIQSEWCNTINFPSDEEYKVSIILSNLRKDIEVSRCIANMRIDIS